MENLCSNLYKNSSLQVDRSCHTPYSVQSASRVSHKGICLVPLQPWGYLRYSRISPKALNAVNTIPAWGVIGLELQESGESPKGLVRGAAWAAVTGKSREGAATQNRGCTVSPQRATSSWLPIPHSSKSSGLQLPSSVAFSRSTSRDVTARHAITMGVC